MALGAGLWLAPRPAMAVLGFDGRRPQVKALSRLAGTRDVALGVAALATLDEPGPMRRVATLNACVDAGDALVFALALVRREGIDRAGVVGTLSGAAGALAGAILVLRT